MLDLARRISDWAFTNPDSIAAAFPTEGITYGTLHDRAEELVQAVRGEMPTHEANQSDIFGIYIRNRVDFVTAFYATALSGHRLAVLDPVWTRTQLMSVLESVAVGTVITEPQYIDLFRDTGARVHILQSEEQSQTGATPSQRQQLDYATYRDDAPFLIGFTSGTTSSPKGFVRTRGSWNYSFALSTDVFQAGPGDVTLAPGPLAHGLTLYALAESLYSGGLFVGVEKFSLAAVSAIASDYRPTRVVCVPTILKRITEYAAAHAWLNGVKTVVTSGAKVRTRQLAQLFSVAPLATHYEYYGASELGFVSYRTNHNAGMGKKLEEAETDVGVPFPSVILAVGEDHQADPGEVGTVFVQSPLVSDGYLTPSRNGFRREGNWCTVGDKGFIANGRLHMIGREGDMLIKNGNNIYPSEVEVTLESHPAVKEACVFLNATESELVAVVTARSTEAPLTHQGLQTFLSARIARYTIPHSFALVEEMPRTNSGKIARGILAEMYSQGRAKIEQLK